MAEAQPVHGERSFDERLDGVLRARIPGCRRLVSHERLSGGASQETYRLVIEDEDGGERRLALRRAPGGVSTRPAAGQPGLDTEALLMRCARAAGVPEPEVYWVLEPGDNLGEGFVMEWLEGEALGARIVRDPAFQRVRARLAYQCGQILARIHAIDLEATGLAQRLNRMAPETFVRQTWARYQALATPQPMIDYTARWLLAHLPRAAAEKRWTLVHNDFRNGNFMVGRDGVVAVLDWEIAHVGDPMRDLGWICTNSWRFGRSDLPVGGFGTYQDLFAGYQSVARQPVDPERVEFWEVFGSFWWAVGCLGMAEHYRSGPDRTVERPAIGRRTSECQVDCVNLLIPGAVELLAPAPFTSTLDMPRRDELLVAVRDFLRQEVMVQTHGRTQFLARVAGNALDVVLRELAVGDHHRAWQRERLRALVGGAGSEADEEDLEALKWKLVHGLRGGEVALETPGLAEYLRGAVVNQVAIDQPNYSGYKTAAARAASGEERG